MKNLRIILESNFNKTNNEERALVHLHNKLSNHYKFNDEDIKPIKDYTKDSSRLNAYQWKKKENGYKNAYHKESEERTSEMDDILDRHRTPHKLTLFSGTPHDPREAMNKEKIVNHPAYLSTSLSKKIAKDFSGHVLKIHVPKGHPGAYVDHHSYNGSEKEFILPRDTKMKYKFTQEHKLDDGSTVFEHHMDVIPSNI
jgi:hypothetical protein